MKILITGISGFVGEALACDLISQGYQVYGAVRSLERVEKNKNISIEFVEVGEINDKTDWSEALASGIDVVVHLAARVHVMHETASDPLFMFRQVNVEGTKRLARKAADAGVKRLVYLSSIKVNGGERLLAYNENDTPVPQGDYGLSKWEAEQELEAISRETGLEVVIIRPPLVYGPKVKANFLRIITLAGKSLPVPFGRLKNLRSMVFLGNLTSAIILCAKHPQAAGHTFLVSDDDDISVRELFGSMAKEIGKPAWMLPIPVFVFFLLGKILGKSAEVDRLVKPLRLDCNLIKEKLGWSPPYSVEKGIKETVQWFKSYSA